MKTRNLMLFFIVVFSMTGCERQSLLPLLLKDLPFEYKSSDFKLDKALFPDGKWLISLRDSFWKYSGYVHIMATSGDVDYIEKIDTATYYYDIYWAPDSKAFVITASNLYGKCLTQYIILFEMMDNGDVKKQYLI